MEKYNLERGDDGRAFVRVPYRVQGNFILRSDQVAYFGKNIPVTYFSLGYAQDYHMQTDEPQYIDYDHSARLGRFVHDVMMAISERKTRPAIAGPDPSYPTCR